MSMSMKKYRATVHYIISLSKEPLSLGAVRLYKTLWFADVMAYQATGSSVSGATYTKRAHGPFPEKVRDVLDGLADDGLISIGEPQEQYMPREFESLQAPGDVLSDEEKGFVLRAIRFVLDHTAREISEKTHTRIWEIAEEGEEIPLFATLGDRKAGTAPQISSEAEMWARDQISRIVRGDGDADRCTV